MFGPIIAAPLATPVSRVRTPPRSSSRVKTLMHRVGRQDGPRHVLERPRRRRSRHDAPDALLDLRHRQVPADDAGGRDEELLRRGSRRPSAASAVMRRASAMPRGPVQALALPEQTTTPRTSSAGRRSWQTRTGAALTRFCVKTPAAAAGRSLTTRARSRAVAVGADAAVQAREAVAPREEPGPGIVVGCRPPSSFAPPSLVRLRRIVDLRRRGDWSKTGQASRYGQPRGKGAMPNRYEGK